MDHEEADAETSETSAPDPKEKTNIEAKAREWGWKPLDEFDGEPDAWHDAEEYIKRSDPRYLRQELTRTERRVKGLEKAQNQERQAFEQRLQRMERLSLAQRQKLYRDIEAARRSAVEIGDTAEYDRLNAAEEQLYNLEREADTAGKSSPQTRAAPKAEEVHPDVERWVDANPWFLKDKVLNRAAQGIHEALLDDEPELTVAQNLARTKRELMRRFPEKFTKASENGGGGRNAVETGGQRQGTSTRGGGKAWGDIPSEEKNILERHISEGLYKDKADAASAYWS
nr:hypothetical protein [uncultured archaeon]